MVFDVIALNSGREGCSAFVTPKARDISTYLEHHRVGDSDGEVGEHGPRLVCLDAFESEIVRDFMNRKEYVLICGASNCIGGK